MSKVTPRPYHICDVCERKFSTHEYRYTFKQSWDENGKVIEKEWEMCPQCMDELQRLVQNKKQIVSKKGLFKK